MADQDLTNTPGLFSFPPSFQLANFVLVIDRSSLLLTRFSLSPCSALYFCVHALTGCLRLLGNPSFPSCGLLASLTNAGHKTDRANQTKLQWCLTTAPGR